MDVYWDQRNTPRLESKSQWNEILSTGHFSSTQLLLPTVFSLSTTCIFTLVCRLPSILSSHLPTYSWTFWASPFLQQVFERGKKKKHLRETIVGSWFSTLPNFSNLLQTATNKIKREYYFLNTHGKPIPNEKARFWQCSEDCIGNGWWNGHSLKAHISLTWQNFVSRSFPNACLVQSSMRGAPLAWHQVNPLVIAGVSLLWRGSLLHSQMGFRRACQENFKVWNVTEKKVAASFNCLLSVQTMAFHIFMQRLHITQCENRVKKCGKWVCAYVFNWVQCWVPNFDQADQTGGLCESLQWWNLVAIAAN